MSERTQAQRRVVVVGAGMAGVQTAVALREQGYSGTVTVIGAEPHQPYDRPPLSKAVLLGKAEGSAFDVDFEALGIELLLGREALGLRPEAHELDTGAGPVPYDVLVLATGAEPIRLPGTEGVPGVHLLRTLDDAERLRALPPRQLRRAAAGPRRVRHRRARGGLRGDRRGGRRPAARGRAARRGGRPDDLLVRRRGS